MDAIFTPIRRVAYEVENMRVGDKTNHNRLRISIETDGTLTAREALSRSIEIMINQLKAIVDFKEPEVPTESRGSTTHDKIGVGKELEERTYVIVGSEEADMALGKISNRSPMGVALFGKKKGQSISFQTPNGVVNYKIIKVS